LEKDDCYLLIIIILRKMSQINNKKDVIEELRLCRLPENSMGTTRPAYNVLLQINNVQNKKKPLEDPNDAWFHNLYIVEILLTKEQLERANLFETSNLKVGQKVICLFTGNHKILLNREITTVKMKPLSVNSTTINPKYVFVCKTFYLTVTLPSEKNIDLLETICRKLTTWKVHRPTIGEANSLSEKLICYGEMLAEHIDNTMDYRKSQIVQAKEYVTYGIRQSAEFLKERLGPRVETTSSIRVPPLLRETVTMTDSILASTKSIFENVYTKAIVVASSVQQVTMGVTTFPIVSGYRVLRYVLGPTANHLDRVVTGMADRAQEGTKELVSTMTQSVYDIVDESKKALGDVVEHKFGEEVGEMAKKSANILQNGVETYLYWQYGADSKTIMLHSTLKPRTSQSNNLLTFNS